MARCDLTRILGAVYNDGMEVNLSPELEAKIERRAAQQRCDSPTLVREAVERLFAMTSGLYVRLKKV